MKQSKLFTKTFKEAPKDEESKNAQLLVRAGFVEKVMAGVYNFLPLGLRVFKNIEEIIRKEMKKVGGKEVMLSSLQPKEKWDQTGRWETYDALFKFESFYSKIKYVLGPTHEEMISPLANKHLISYRDLPAYIFQIQNKFRDEKRAKSGLLRGREFFMKDLYSFHKDEKDLDNYYQKLKDSYRRIFEKVGLGDCTYLTLAPGGTFSKYSHEFQTLTEAGEDIIHICEKCNLAINDDIIDQEDNQCPECGNKDLREEKAAEVGNIFKLKTKYSKPFDLKYIGEDEQEHLINMGCYGIGLNRLMGTIVEVFHDEDGIIWPESVAPFKVHVLRLGDSKEIKQKSEEVYKKLKEAGVEALFDDRERKSAGEKFADADLIGIPYRLVVSEKTLEKESVEIKKRDKQKEKLIKINNLVEKIKNL